MQRQSMIPMEMILTCCSDLHTRESRLEWSRQLLTVIFTEKKYAIVLTVSFLGSKLKDGDRVIMIEDVTTSGKSMEETVPKVKGAADVTIVGLMVSLNRMEVGKGGEKCALDEIKDLYGFDTAAIVTMEEVVECLYNKECDGKVVIDDTLKEAIDAYYEQYGAK